MLLLLGMAVGALLLSGTHRLLPALPRVVLLLAGRATSSFDTKEISWHLVCTR